jgi:uncharacterized SAM-binding protein YcdF (DUF218 family)
VLTVFVILLTVFCAATGWLFVFPSTGMPAKVGAIVVPGGPGSRIDAALSLARQDRAPYLVLSDGAGPGGLCGTRVGTVSVLCFMPDPDTTQGEAEATARLAREYGFRSIVLVTTPDQTWRAKLRFRRCYSGEIFAVTTPLPLSQWPFQIAYQWAATVKAEVVNRGC